MNESDCEDFPNTPPDVAEAANAASLELLPEKSKIRYIRERSIFVTWCKQKNIKKFTESVLLAYFAENSKKMKSSTLWSSYSMLKTCLIVQDNVDISKFSKLIAFLKRKSVGYRAKKSRIFTRTEISRFLLEAPDESFLMMKVNIMTYGLYFLLTIKFIVGCTNIGSSWSLSKR